jgi:hypothetical protein
VHLCLTAQAGENPAAALWRSYQQQLQIRPLITKAWTSGIISALGDIIAQWISKSAGVPFSIDTKRLIQYSIVGFVYVPVVIHNWFIFLDKVAEKTQV